MRLEVMRWLRSFEKENERKRSGHVCGQVKY
jgi:hypothetical protein